MATGLFVTHPLTGEQVEVWVGNYVLMSYGDGAVMGVPAHDERDFAFALKYDLPIKQVVAVEGRGLQHQPSGPTGTPTSSAGVAVNSGNSMAWISRHAVDAVAADLAAKGLGEKKTTWRLRDWGVSRQRYWGTPIPIIHCDEHGAVPVPEKDLPVVLPQDCVPDGSGNPLHKHEGFHAGVTCPDLRQGGAPRDRHHGHLRGSLLVLHALLRPQQRRQDGGRRRRLLDADGPVHRRHRARHPAPAVRALLDQGHARPGPGQGGRALHQAADPGHGAQPHLQSRRTEKGGKDYFWPHDVEHVLDEAGKVIGAQADQGRGRSAGGHAPSTTRAWAPCPSPRTTASIRRT